MEKLKYVEIYNYEQKLLNGKNWQGKMKDKQYVI